MCVAFYFLFLQFLPIATDEMDETQKNMKTPAYCLITNFCKIYHLPNQSNITSRV
jgi:hypothetical protein